MRKKKYYVYILASKRNGTLYVGVTNNLTRRLEEHRDKKLNSFTSKYNICKLVFYERFEKVADAIYQEKCIKKWKRAWKIRLIEEVNPEWKDLSEDF